MTSPLIDRGIELAQSLCKTYFEVKPKGFIAASRNALDSAASRSTDRVAIDSLDQTIAEVARQNQLKIPPHFDGPVEDHCVSLSLKFIQQYRQTGNIAAAAQAVAKGADKTCAQGTLLYHSLYQANKTLSGDQLLYALKTVVARFLGLAFKKEVVVHLPVEDMFAYLNAVLPRGEWLIAMPNHVVAVVKDGQNRLYLYDSEQGTVDLAQNSSWFLQYMVRNKVHLKEKITLYHVQEASLAEQPPMERATVDTEATRKKPEITIEPSSGRWSKVNFRWRGITHRFVRDTVTREFYNGDSPNLIRFKCALLCPGTLLAATARTIVHMALGIFHLLRIPYAALKGRASALASLHKAQRAFVNAIRSPIYGIMGIGAALYGLFKPYDGRCLYGYLERCLNRQNDAVDRKSAFYLALCFVPLNFNTSDRRNEEEAIEHLQKTINWNRYFRKKNYPVAL